MTELREVVTPQDRSRFDDIVYRRHSLDISRNYFNSRARVSMLIQMSAINIKRYTITRNGLLFCCTKSKMCLVTAERG